MVVCGGAQVTRSVEIMERGALTGKIYYFSNWTP